jgi:putative FmdB family regulatory protein
MPVYEYECSQHGVFELSRSMRESALAAHCPQCHGASARILSLSALAAVPAATRIAKDRNERSCHEPFVAKGAALGSSSAPTERPAVHASRGRPWMMSGCG